MKKWNILYNSKVTDLTKVLLKNRGLRTKKEVEGFLDPRLGDVTTDAVLIDKKQLQKAIERVNKAIERGEQIVVFGDYDVDGICGSAILWETLRDLGASAMPYIPHRIDEGYGLSIAGISNIKDQKSKIKDCSLMITVDNGIVANEAVEFANKQGIDVIITDHHVPSKKLPKAFAIVHTTKLCGAGVAWALAQQLTTNNKQLTTHLELVVLATIADLIPLLGANRTLTKFGLEKLRTTKRVGLLELFKEAALDSATIDVYEVGHIIAPRLNAMGRIEHAMDSLRLLCTTDPNRARNLAHKLGSTNRERQRVTEETVNHASSKFKVPARGPLRSEASEARQRRQSSKLGKLLFIAHESYQQGVIGLVAGKLVEEFYRPAIVVSKGEKYSKASARSIAGFNMIEFIRSASELLVDAGGHPMAAGFTVETTKLAALKKVLEGKAEELLDRDILTKALRIDCELPLSLINDKLYDQIQRLQPFGMGNPEPTFVSRGVTIEDMRLVGQEGKHLKLKLQQSTNNHRHSGIPQWRDSQQTINFDGIAFGMGERAQAFHIGDTVDIVYTIEQDEWNRTKRLQLKLKDLRKSTSI